MKVKTTLRRVASFLLTVGLLTNIGVGNFALSDELNQINTDSSILDRKFTLDTYSSVYEASANSGETAPNVMSVIGAVSEDGSQYATINYKSNYYGFVVKENITLNLTDVKFMNAKTMGASGSVVNNSGILNINNVVFYKNRIEPSGNANGGAIYNTGTINQLKADFEGNIVSGYSVKGGAIYNTGTINTVSGNFIDNSASGNSDALGGAIYTSTNMTLLADGEDYKISGNTIKEGISTTSQAIFVFDNDISAHQTAGTETTLTISAKNGGSWVIDDSINGTWDNSTGTYYRYNVTLTGDTNSSIFLNDEIQNADVTIQDVNVYISKDTFKTSDVYFRSSSNVSLLDNSTKTYNFNILDTKVATAANFDFDIDGGNGTNDVINTGILSYGNVIVHDLNFIDGHPVAGTFRLLNSPTTNISLKLISGNNQETYTYTDITNTISDNASIYSYDYDITLSGSDTGFVDTIIIDNIQSPVLQDSLNALNLYKTTYDRNFNFTSDENIYTAKTSSGKTSSGSILNINGRIVDEKYSKIDYGNNYSGFELGVGSEIKTNKLTFTNAISEENGAVFNLNNSNASLIYSDGLMTNNTSTKNGGAIAIKGNSFINLVNVDFTENSAVEGGAIYSYSTGVETPYITNIIGDFTNNSAQTKGGAIANVTDYSQGKNSGLISNISADFTNNKVQSANNVYGGAIYNTGIITNLVGDFNSNSAISENGNAYGGAIYNGQEQVLGISHKGLISNIDSSFINNFAKAENGNAYGGAIYTANDLTFNHSDNSSPMVFSGNYTEDANGKRSNAIFVDTTNGTSTIIFNLTNGATLQIDDEIDGGSVENGVITRENTNGYTLVLQGQDKSENVILNDVENNSEIVAGIRNATNTTITGVNLTAGTKTFYGENTKLTISNSIFNAKDGVGKTYYFTTLNSIDTVDYNMDFRAYVDNDEVKVDKDVFWVGSGSTGIIRLTDINLNREELFTAARFLEEQSRFSKEGGYIIETILDRETSTNNIQLILDFTILNNPEYKTIKDNYLDTDGVYRLNDTDFIGEIGFRLNNTADSFIVGVLSRKDQLGEINRFKLDSNLPTNRELNITQHDIYNATEDLGETGIGSLKIIGGENKSIDFKNFIGFIVKDDTTLTLNNISLNNAAYAIKSDSNISNGYNIILNDVSFIDNDVAISNLSGRIYMKNAKISFTDKAKQNTLRNDGYIYMHSTDNNPSGIADDGTKSYTRLYRSIINNGTIEVSGTTYFGLDSDNGIQISGGGNIILEDDAIYTNMEYAQLAAENNVVNTLTLNSNILRIGSSTLSEAEIKTFGGVIDLSGSTIFNPKTQQYNINKVDLPYNINTYSFVNNSDTSFIIDIDFGAFQADQISIDNVKLLNSDGDVITNPSSGDKIVVNVNQINGVETLKSSVQTGELKILTAPSNVEFKIKLNPDSFIFYVDTYKVIDDDGILKYILTNDDFIGEVHLKPYQKSVIRGSGNSAQDGTEGGILIEKNPIYNGIVELNQLARYLDDPVMDIRSIKDRIFILTEKTADAETEYQLPLNLGKTYEGNYIVKAQDGMTENGKIAKINMYYLGHQANYSGFEIESDEVTTLTINGVEFRNAITYGRNEYQYVPKDEDDHTVPLYTYRGQPNGSVIYLNSSNPNTTVTLIDTVMSSNTSYNNNLSTDSAARELYGLYGRGGAIYASNDLTIIAKYLNSTFSDNIHKKDKPDETAIVEPYPGDPNDIYIAPNANGQDINLKLIAYKDKSIDINSGLYVEQGTPLNLYVNDNNADGNGVVHINLNKTNLGSETGPIKLLSLNGGTFDLRDNTISTIYAPNMVINSSTKFNVDLDLRRGLADKIWTNGMRAKQGDANSYILLSKDGFKYIDDAKPDVSSVQIKILDIKSPTTDFMYFLNDEGEKTDGILLYTIDDTNYYAKLGLNGSIIVGSDPDCSDDPLIANILSEKNKTYKLTENKEIYNYGPLTYIGEVQSKKLTIKGDSYSVISTPSSIKGFALNGTEKIKPSKQQIVASNFDMKGFNGAFINNGGKITLNNVNFYKNETDAYGSVLQNYSGKAYLKGKKKQHAQIYNNFATQGGGAVYNNGTLSVNYVDFGALGGNNSYIGGALYNTGSATISNSIFSNNTADLNAGAVYLGGYSKLNSDTFTSNSAVENGGAIYISSIPHKKYAVNINKNNFYTNSADNGGAVYVDKGKVSISKSNFGSTTTVGNTATNGGAIYVADTVVEEEYVKNNVVTLTSNKFAQNSADNGGVIYNKGIISSSKNSFGLTDKSKNQYPNTAENGGAVYNSGTFTDKSSTIAYNTASDKGGAIYNDGIIASYNKKQALTGGLNSTKINYNKAQTGGGVYNTATFGTSKATFTGNTATNGGGLYNEIDGEATLINSTFVQNESTANGGAVYNKGTLNLNKTKIGKSKLLNANKAVAGSAIYNEGTLNSTGSNISYNIATGNGALYNTGTANIASTTFGFNNADKGGAIYNIGTLNIDYKTKFNSNSAVNGGAVYNTSDIATSLNGGNFSKNIATENGGAIFNDKTLTIDRYDYVYTQNKKEKHKYYNSSMSSNMAKYGGGVYNTGDLTVSYTTLSGNKANNNNAALTYEDINQSGNGGAVYNTNKLTVTNSTFKSNNAVTTLTNVSETPSEDGLKTITTTTTRYGGNGGAVYNTSDNSTVSDSSFISNKAGQKGGAIATYGNLSIENSTFTSNTTVNKITQKQYTTTIATGKKSGTKTISNVNDTTSTGGAIYLAEGKTLFVADSKFDKNTSAFGGAIYADKNTTVTIKDTSFTNNSALEKGGAIYADEGSTVYVVAQNKDVTFKGNKANGVANDIYLNNATVHLVGNNNHWVKIFGDITGDGNGKYSVTGQVSIAETATLQGVNLIVNNGILHILNESGVLGTSLLLGNSSNLSTVNNKIGKLSLKSLMIENNAVPNVAIDMDLKNGSSDKISANDTNEVNNGGLNVSSVNLVSDSKTPVTIKVGEDSKVTSVSATNAETKEATYKLKSRLGAGGMLETVAYGQKAKPCALAAPVAAQLGGYLTQINSYDQAFMNMDMNMTKTLEERKAEMSARTASLPMENGKWKMENYADEKLAYSPQFSNGINQNGKGLWARPYATFERVNLSGGPKVGSIGYGTFFGGDADIKQLRNGWSRQFSAYIGYNGSTQDYDRQSIDQNGGTIGVTEVWYKNNFFTGLTVNVSGNSAMAQTDLGHENFPMIMAGVASKTGYNFEFKQGKFVIQPSILLSYSFVHTFSHKNGIGHRVSSSPLHAIQVAPGIKFIANLPKGWQPYLGINMRWNIMDKTHFSLPDVSIPDMSIRPYVEYGVGLQRKWGERFTGYGQAMLRNGGRNGVMLSVGFKWAIGK